MGKPINFTKPDAFYIAAEMLSNHVISFEQASYLTEKEEKAVKKELHKLAQSIEKRADNLLKNRGITKENYLKRKIRRMSEALRTCELFANEKCNNHAGN